MEKLRNDTSSFMQMDLETLYNAWERYKDLLRRCPHRGLPLWLQVQTFHNGLNPSTRQMVDVAVGGTINNKTPEDAYEFIEEMSLNNYQLQVMRTKPTKATGVFNVASVTMLSNQVRSVMQCEASGGVSSNTEYSPYSHSMENEQLKSMGNNPRAQNNLYSITYNAGSLPSNTGPNPREQLNAINVRNEEGLVTSELEPKQETVVSKGKGEVSHTEQKLVSVEYKPHVPYPNVTKKDRSDEQFDAERNEVLKELLANKQKLDEASHVELNAVCSAILQNKLPNKLKDLRSFTIPCLIGSLDVNNALADLGVSINVMPYKMFKQLGLGKPKQTRMSIQLADKTIRFPRGIIEDVLVKIDKFIFLVDFIILDIEEDSNTPLILGRPFLETARTIIDVGTEEQSLFKLAIRVTH
ncbi:hypothetical protein CXB51_014153 [Gossypium anomalum]|uniref:Retrotransposon gag domain-containing protein n=1 Tax=Gossypium anomalum TaxID=47600 RepID=A0A8J5YK95_9ROSI|nr:hypothetical protein CXB51_014153 [Gossypium anomalum]